MKAITREDGLSRRLNRLVARTLVVAGFFICAGSGLAQLAPPGGGGGGPVYVPLDTWSFYDSTNWTSDQGFYPVSFANLNASELGDFSSLIVDSAAPAWLQYNVTETNVMATNLMVNCGTAMFWFAPNWSSVGQSGSGPGEYGRLLEVGAYTTNSSFGWWSLYVDDAGNNLYFSAQTNDLSSTFTAYLSAPISWNTNYFHFVALTYSATNTALYLDGNLAASGSPMTVYPGPDVLAGGFFVGSDSNGIYQAHGSFSAMATYNTPLDADTIQQLYNYSFQWFLMNPMNRAMFQIASAPSTPGAVPIYDAITGTGNLVYVTNLSTCVSSANPYTVWITNVTATIANNGLTTITFSITGGQPNVPYDVFVNSVLDFSANTNRAWAWEGQGSQCNTYMLANMPATTCYLILGSPQDSDFDGLTDAYEVLVSKTNLHNPDTDGDGISDSDEVLLHLNPLSPNLVLPTAISVTTCPQ